MDRIEFLEKLRVTNAQTGYPGGEVQFKADALEALEIQDNPKRDALYSIAWEYGHSSGYHEVWYHLDELADLIR